MFFLKIENGFIAFINTIKKEDTALFIVKMFAISIIGIAILSVFYFILKPNIDKYDERIDISYIKELFERKGAEITVNKTIINKNNYYYKVLEDNEFIGYATKETVRGHNDNITFIIGIFKDNSLAGIKTIKHKETLRVSAFIEDDEYMKLFSSSHIKDRKRAKIIDYHSIKEDEYNKKLMEDVETEKKTIEKKDIQASILRAIEKSYMRIRIGIRKYKTLFHSNTNSRTKSYAPITF
jgi:Na+-translocating ferredoxin:NAD+ oxidoreductase RnfG subunit